MPLFVLNFFLSMVISMMIEKGFSPNENRIIIMSLYAQIQKNIVNYYRMLIQQSSVRYAKETVFGVGIMIALVAGYLIHGFYVKKREEQAFGALTEVVESFEKAQYEVLHSENKTDDQDINVWQNTEEFIDSLYKQNANSYLAPYFLIFKSQVALERGVPIDEVRVMLETALAKMSKHTPLFDLFNFKRIMISFDSQDQVVRDAALSELIAVANDEQGYVFEEANYLLGLYYVQRGDIDQARKAWENVVHKADKKALLPSPWVKQAEEKLESIKLA